MYGQLDLEVIFNLLKIGKRPSNFHKFWNEEVHCRKKGLIIRTLMFECHNLMNPIKLRDVISWCLCPRGQLQDHVVIFLSLFSFWKKDFSKCVQIYIILSKMHKEFTGSALSLIIYKLSFLPLRIHQSLKISITKQQAKPNIHCCKLGTSKCSQFGRTQKLTYVGYRY